MTHPSELPLDALDQTFEDDDPEMLSALVESFRAGEGALYDDWIQWLRDTGRTDILNGTVGVEDDDGHTTDD